MLISALLHVGQSAFAALRQGGATLIFLLAAFGHIARHGVPLRATVTLIADLGLRCVVPVSMVLAPLGAVLAMQGHITVQMFGVERLLGPMVALSLVREIGPGITAVMVAMQAGGSIAAELGAMRVNNEIDAYEVMAVDPIRALVAPRIVAGIIVAPMLNLLAIITGMGSAYLVAVYGRGVAGAAFIDNALAWVQFSDLWSGEFKALIYGLAITAISTYQGFYAERSAAGVGLAANRAVVQAIVIIPMVNYVMNSALYAGMT